MVTSPELIYFASRRITATNSYAQTTTIFCLVAWPLGWGHGEWLLASGGVLLAREGSSELSEGSLVVAHANSEGLEVVELVGETHGTAVEEHEVTGVVGHLVHLESTLAEHGLLELEEKVLAETHGPAGTHGVGDTGVLVDEAVDLVDGVVNLNVLGSEDSGDLGGTSTDTLGLDSLDVGETRDGGQEVSEGGEVLALALDDVLLELVAGSDGVGLEGEVVISDLLVGALDGLEEVVSGVLNTLRDLDEHGTLLASEVATGTVGHTASLRLTNHDGAGDSLLHILAHGLGLLTDELTVELASGLVAADHTGEHLEAGLDLAGVGGDDVTEGVEASVEGSLGGADGSGGLLAVGRDGGSVGLVLVGSLKLDVGKLGVETLGGLGKVTGSLNTVRSGTATDLGELAHEELVEGVDLRVNRRTNAELARITKLSNLRHSASIRARGKLRALLDENKRAASEEVNALNKLFVNKLSKIRRRAASDRIEAARDLSKASQRLYAKLANIQLKAAYENKSNAAAIASYGKKSAAAIRTAKTSLNARLNTLGNVIAANSRKVEAGFEVLTGVIRSHKSAGKLDRKLIREQTKSMGQDMQKAISRAIMIGEAKARRVADRARGNLAREKRAMLVEISERVENAADNLFKTIQGSHKQIAY